MEQAQSSTGLSEDRARDQGQMQSCIAQWQTVNSEEFKWLLHLLYVHLRRLSECFREAVLT